MRIKKQFMVIIITAMLVASSVLAYMTYVSVQEDRVGYIGIEVDKKTFNSSEDVTFHLVSLTKNAKFNITDHWYEWASDEYDGLNIIRVPDDADPETFLNDHAGLDYLQSSSITIAGKAYFDYFDSRDGSIQITWNGTIRSSESGVNGWTESYTPAVSGYYVVMPKVSYYTAYDNHVFMIDEKSIFYYDSLNVDIDAINVPDTDVTIDLTLRLPPGVEDNVTCDANITLSYDNVPFDYDDDVKINYHLTNETLTPGREKTITLVFNVTVPDHGYEISFIEDSPETYFSTVLLQIVLMTSLGVFISGFSATWDGGWDYQFYY